MLRTIPTALLLLACAATASDAPLDELRAALASDSPRARYEAAEALGGRGDAARAALPMLGELLADREQAVRTAAARAIVRLGAEPRMLDTLVARLETADADLARLVGEALAGLGEAALPVLRERLGHERAPERLRALVALEWMGPDAGPLTPLVLDRLVDENPGVRRQAGETLQRIGPWADAVVADIVDRLRFGPAEVRWAAASVLGRLGPRAAAAAAALREVRDGDDAHLAEAAASAFRRVQPPRDPRPPHPDLRKPHKLTAEAPARFRLRFETTRGTFRAEFVRAWAPHGVDRVWNLAQVRFFDGAPFFRVLAGQVAQFGIHARGKVSTAWQEAAIPDDEPQVPNRRGTIAFAHAGPGTRTTQLFVNLSDNTYLDRQGFAPVGRVVDGLAVVERLYAGYGDGPPRGSGPDQNMVQYEGNVYLEREFPKVDRIVEAEPVPLPEPADGEEGE